MIKTIFAFWAVSFLTSCSSYIKEWHREIDRKPIRKSYLKGTSSREGQGSLRRSSVLSGRYSNKYSRSRSGKRVLSTADTNYLPPQVQRRYGKTQKRNQVNDLYDNGSEGSLWRGVGQESYFFSKNNIKKNGDIVIINVGEKLKRDIMLELSRRFPKMLNRKKKKKSDVSQNTNSKEEANKERRGIHERISGVVIEEINQGHLIVRGRKDIFHRKAKRLVEVQALIARRDIGDLDTIHSDKILESKVLVLR